MSNDSNVDLPNSLKIAFLSNLKFLLDKSIAVPFGDGYYLVDDVIMDEDELKLYEHMKKLGINPSDRGKVDDLI